MSTVNDLLTVPVHAYPGFVPRLASVTERESLEQYLAAGGYAPLRDPDALLDHVAASGLRGRGGAAFPLARKIATVRSAGITPILVANGEEGEPAAVKDKWLLRHRPHLVLDGVRLAAAMIGAQRAYVYLSDAGAAEAVEAALAEFPAAGWNELEVIVHLVEPSYVAGEETAAVRSINGGPALPSDKPPRPFERGVEDRPTLISNVETLGNLPTIHAIGGAEYRALGTDDSPGTFLMTLTTPEEVILAEVPYGITIRDVLDWRGYAGAVGGALIGGYFAGLASARILDVPLDFGAMRAAGSGLGCGAIVIFADEICPVTVASGVLRYFAVHNAGQCGSCFNGTSAMAAVADGLRTARAAEADVERLRRWSSDLRGRGACGTLDGATNVAATLLGEFPELVASHLAGACTSCENSDEMPAPFAVGR